MDRMTNQSLPRQNAPKIIIRNPPSRPLPFLPNDNEVTTMAATARFRLRHCGLLNYKRANGQLSGLVSNIKPVRVLFLSLTASYHG
jgi:hypothetical protein